MPDRPDPYVRKDPNDLIRSGDWNELQIQTREEIHSHTHTGIHDGKHHGSVIPGAAIDRATEVSVKTLTTSGDLTVGGDLRVDGKLLLAEVADLLATVKGLRGNVGIGTDTPRARLEINGNLNVTDGLVRKISVATGLGPCDDTNNGQIISRVLSFNKVHAETAIRIIYCDAFRVRGNDSAARWEIKVNGNAPPGGRLCYDKCSKTSLGQTVVTSHNEPGTIVGYAVGIPAGMHVIGVWVGPIAPYACDAATGWESSRWTLEAQEVWM